MVYGFEICELKFCTLRVLNLGPGLAFMFSRFLSSKSVGLEFAGLWLMLSGFRVNFSCV